MPLVENVAFAVVRIDVFESQDEALILIMRSASDHGWNAGAGIDFLSAGVVADFVGCAAHQDFALIHDRHTLGKAEDSVDVVLDDEDRDVGSDIGNEARYALAFGGGAALASDLDDDVRHGGGRASTRHGRWRGCPEPPGDRLRYRRRHDVRHAVYLVRGAHCLHTARKAALLADDEPVVALPRAAE